MSTSNNRTTDEAEIRDLVESWARAVRTKNLDGILANHSPEILMFDVPPPAQSKGMPYGFREYGARDLEGRLWSFLTPLS